MANWSMLSFSTSCSESTWAKSKLATMPPSTISFSCLGVRLSTLRTLRSAEDRLLAMNCCIRELCLGCSQRSCNLIFAEHVARRRHKASRGFLLDNR